MKTVYHKYSWRCNNCKKYNGVNRLKNLGTRILKCKCGTKAEVTLDTEEYSSTNIRTVITNVKNGRRE